MCRPGTSRGEERVRRRIPDPNLDPVPIHQVDMIRDHPSESRRIKDAACRNAQFKQSLEAAFVIRRGHLDTHRGWLLVTQR